MWLVLALVLVMIIPPIGASLFICVPKWWQVEVVDRFNRIFNKDVEPPYNTDAWLEWNARMDNAAELRRIKQQKLDRLWFTPHKILFPVRLVWGVPFAILYLVVGGLVLWVQSCIMLVTRKCPYGYRESADYHLSSWERVQKGTLRAVKSNLRFMVGIDTTV